MVTYSNDKIPLSKVPHFRSWSTWLTSTALDTCWPSKAGPWQLLLLPSVFCHSTCSELRSPNKCGHLLYANIWKKRSCSRFLPPLAAVFGHGHFCDPFFNFAPPERSAKPWWGSSDSTMPRTQTLDHPACSYWREPSRGRGSVGTRGCSASSFSLCFSSSNRAIRA